MDRDEDQKGNGKCAARLEHEKPHDDTHSALMVSGRRKTSPMETTGCTRKDDTSRNHDITFDVSGLSGTRGKRRIRTNEPANDR